MVNKKDVIIACDFADRQQTLSFLKLFTGNCGLPSGSPAFCASPSATSGLPSGSLDSSASALLRKPFVKVGMELFYAEGPDIVREIKAMGFRIFLDLKLHDIPNTVKKAMRVLSCLDVDMCNLHAAGTRSMMEAAIEGLTRPDGSRPLLLAVTQLTSTDQTALDNELLIHAPIENVVISYARNAQAAGLDGVVCSPLESAPVHAACGADFLTVTPGVRFPENAVGDQKRVTTPSRAAALGSDYIVMGRPITAAPDPVSAYIRAVNEFCG